LRSCSTLGRSPEARFVDRYEYLREEVVTREELHWVEERLGAFGTDNRAGIPATLHRISAMRNRRGEVVGLTLRIGRAVMGIVDIVRDIIESGESVLLMGRPVWAKPRCCARWREYSQTKWASAS
jgi:stage III sporulation protein SpoIIIAA